MELLFWLPLECTIGRHFTEVIYFKKMALSRISVLSCIFFLFFYALLLFLKSKTNRKALIAVSAVSLLGFLDELSFGERLFELKMPLICGVKIDAAHDFFVLALKVTNDLVRSHSTYGILFLLSGIIVVTVLLFQYRVKLTKMITRNYHEPPFILALIFTVLIYSVTHAFGF